MTDRDLFPSREPYRSGALAVDDVHTLYWEESGNPNGVPVIFLHGGPGAGASPTHRRFFDPKAWRVIIFDQRGAGRSTPLGETRNNTVELLIEDIERLRTMLDIKRWHVFGGSWGSTLALAYAQTYPQHVLGLMLRGIFLLRQQEIDWFLYGMRQIFPEAWEVFTNYIPSNERQDLLGAYEKRFNSTDPAKRLEAVRAWSLYEASCSTLLPNPELIAANDDRHALGIAKIEAHYFRNNLFKPENKLLENTERIRKIPGVIVQGRYDIVCPIESAYELHKRWPEADYIIVPDAGHSALEPGIRAALIDATERFKLIKN